MLRSRIPSSIKKIRCKGLFLLCTSVFISNIIRSQPILPLPDSLNPPEKVERSSISFADKKTPICGTIVRGKVVSQKEPTEGASFRSDRIWRSQTLKVKLLTNQSILQSLVEKYARIWENYANIRFQFSNFNTQPDIIVAFEKDKGHWSYVGTDCATAAGRNEPTMNLDIADKLQDEENIRGVILHEFGHALGLDHEHQNPYSGIKWNKSKVYQEYAKMGWSVAEVDAQVFKVHEKDRTNGLYDPESIMHYWISADLTLDGFSVPWRSNLSEGDKNIIKTLYPSKEINPPVVNQTAKFTIESSQIQVHISKDGKQSLRMIALSSLYSPIPANLMAYMFFYDENGNPLKDMNGTYVSNGLVMASSSEMTLVEKQQKTQRFEFFIPIEELHLPEEGMYKLHGKIALWDRQKTVATGNELSFTINFDIKVSAVDIIRTFNDSKREMLLEATTTIENAVGKQLIAGVFFYNSRGDKLYNNQGEWIKYYQYFTPTSNKTVFSSSGTNAENRLLFRITYGDLPLGTSENTVGVYLAIFTSKKQLACSRFSKGIVYGW